MSSATLPYVLVTIVALSLAIGQFLFKIAAAIWRTQEEAGGGILSFLSFPLIGALVLYGGATVLWVYALRFVPLSRGYLFILAGAALVPLLAHFVLKEPLGATYWAGFGMVLAGVFIASL